MPFPSRPLIATAAVATAAVVAALAVPATAHATPATGTARPAAPATAAPHAAVPGSAGPAGPAKAGAHDLTFGLHRGDSLLRKGTPGTTPNTIVSYDLPPEGSNQPLGGYGTYLVLQGDGNLVEYETSTGKVLFAAGNRQAVKFTYQGDGNAVLYSGTGKVLFQTGTRGDTIGHVLLAYGNGQMLIQSAAGRIATSFGTPTTPLPGIVTLFADSPNGKYELYMQPDGNLVEYDISGATDRAIWNTHTAGAGRVRFAVQFDGNLVLYQYPSNKVLWSSHTSTKGVSAYHQLDVQDDGNIVLWRTDPTGGTRVTQIWQSGSTQPTD